MIVDGGIPAHTATATIQITVTDVNDNAPHISTPNSVTVYENSPPQRLADIIMGDADDWNLGHGPPFSVALDQDADWHIKKSFAIAYNPSKLAIVILS